MIAVDKYSSIHEALRDACIQFKTDVALIEAKRRDETHRWQYRDFARRVEAAHGQLQSLGVKSDDRVAIVLSNQSAWLVAATAAFRCGAVVVPLDYKLTPPEQQALLDHCKPSVVVCERHMPLSGDVVLHPEDLVEAGPAGTFVPRQRTDIATIVYSSGTGGSPKGCMLSHGAYLAQLESLLALFPMERGDRYFSILPTNHAIDFLCGFVGPLCCGATVVHQRTLRPEFLLATMQTYGITHMAVVPLILTAFERAVKDKLDALPSWQRFAVDALLDNGGGKLLKPVHDAFGGKLRLLFCGGAFVDPDRAAFFDKLGIPVVIGYGLTEACTVVTVNDLKPFRADSVGPTVPGTEIRIVNPGPDGVGEVQVRGPTLMTGYLDDPEQTAAAFDGEWLRTGDLGWVDASFHLHLVGRSKNMIVTPGGKNIYPEDIEGAFEGVADELAVFAADWIWPRRGLTDEDLVAVVHDDEVGKVIGALRARNRRLPDFKRIRGVVAWSEAFPRTASMKVKRHLLAEQIREQLDRDAVRRL